MAGFFFVPWIYKRLEQRRCPSHEIKVFAEGAQLFTFRNARWHLLDVSAKYEMWAQTVGNPALAELLFQTAFDLSDAPDTFDDVRKHLGPDGDRLLDPPDAIGQESVTVRGAPQLVASWNGRKAGRMSLESWLESESLRLGRFLAEAAFTAGMGHSDTSWPTQYRAGESVPTTALRQSGPAACEDQRSGKPAFLRLGITARP